MRLMGLQAVTVRKRPATSTPGHRIYPYLLRDVVIERPNQVWCAEIVRSQMTKTHMFTARTHGNDVADLDIAVGHDDAVDEEFHQLPFLLKGRMVQPSLYALAKVLDGRHQPGYLLLTINLGG